MSKTETSGMSPKRKQRKDTHYMYLWKIGEVFFLWLSNPSLPDQMESPYFLHSFPPSRILEDVTSCLTQLLLAMVPLVFTFRLGSGQSAASASLLPQPVRWQKGWGLSHATFLRKPAIPGQRGKSPLSEIHCQWFRWFLSRVSFL